MCIYIICTLVLKKIYNIECIYNDVDDVEREREKLMIEIIEETSSETSKKTW